MNAKKVLTGFTCLLTTLVSAQTQANGQWGLGINIRQGQVPYKNGVSNTENNANPVIYYEDDSVFFRGDEGGFKLFNEDKTRIEFVGKRRFVNVPLTLGNKYQLDAVDFGVRLDHDTSENSHWRFEALTTSGWRSQLYAGHEWNFRFDNLELSTNAGLRAKDSRYNSYYYGLDGVVDEGQYVPAGVEGLLGIDARYPIDAGWYLTAGLEWTQLDPHARNSAAIDRNGYSAIKMGVAFFEGNDSDLSFDFREGSYIRGAHGWATPSNLSDIFDGTMVSDEYNNQLSSVFYGHPLKENLLDLPLQLDVYLHTGLIYHHKSSVQDPALEGVISIKGYVHIPWPFKWRIGAAQGISYLSDISYIEQAEMDEKEYEPSNLMNYLDITFDANLGDIFNVRSLDPAWAGWSIHHRSAIFEQASQFGRIKGGSNYNTVYLQWHF